MLIQIEFSEQVRKKKEKIWQSFGPFQKNGDQLDWDSMFAVLTTIFGSSIILFKTWYEHKGAFFFIWNKYHWPMKICVSLFPWNKKMICSNYSSVAKNQKVRWKVFTSRLCFIILLGMKSKPANLSLYILSN